jgi:hypothetical protein
MPIPAAGRIYAVPINLGYDVKPWMTRCRRGHFHKFLAGRPYFIACEEVSDLQPRKTEAPLATSCSQGGPCVHEKRFYPGAGPFVAV